MLGDGFLLFSLNTFELCSVKLLGNSLILLRLDFKLFYAGTEYPLVWTYFGPTTKEIGFWESYLMPVC